VSEDDYVGGRRADGGSNADGGSDSDTGAGDASPTDGGDAGDGAQSCPFPGKTFCASADAAADAAYCNDFDEKPLDSNQLAISDGGAVAIDCTMSRSSPSSLRSTTNAGDGGVRAQLFAQVDDVTIYLRVSFDVLVDTLAVGESALAEMRFGVRLVRVLVGRDQTNATGIRIDYFVPDPDGGAIVRDESTWQSIELTSAWKHIDLEVRSGGAGDRARACVDGIVRAYKLDNRLETGPTGLVNVGLGTVTATGPQNVRIDNLVVTKLRDTPVDGGPECCTCGL
jgi:hypothetical protein